MDIIIKVNNQSNGRDKLASRCSVKENIVWKLAYIREEIQRSKYSIQVLNLHWASGQGTTALSHLSMRAAMGSYASRLIWHQLETRNANKYSIDRIRNLELALSSFRKILRLGRCIDICYTALDSMHIEDPFLRIMLTVSKLAHGLYLYADHIVWLTKSGFLKTDSDNWNKTANRFWLLSIIANLARDFYEILHILELNRTSFLNPSELLGSSRQFDLSSNLKHMHAFVSCHKDVFIDTVKNSCDLFIPLTALGFTKLSPSAVGTLGAISSIAALVTIVKPITKLVP